MPQVIETEKTLSPYFLIKSEDPNIDQFPLQSTDVTVNIAGVIADVYVLQIYKNKGSRPIEATYVFPASTKAAIYGMKMMIGTRTIVAKIKERQQARDEYEEAKQIGKSASLLEQQRPNVFQMNVANILPGDEIKVALNYTEMLVPTDGLYEFVYPTVVGPRYSNQPEADALASDRWVKNPYLHEGEVSKATFNINVNLSAGLPIQDMMCSSHKVNINYEGASLSNIKLEESEKYHGNRDFVLKYRLSGKQIESGVLLYEGENEKFFLLMVQPPKRIVIEQIPPREYIFIVDVSGSMRGFPLDTAKTLMSNLLGNIRPDDMFNILLFSFGSGLLSEESLLATPLSIQVGLDFVREQFGSGGTELLPALERALSLPRTESVSRTIVIITDGYVSLETEAFDMIRNHLGNANMFAFGIGSNVNRYLIEGMARAGAGEPFIVSHPDEVQAKEKKFREYIQSPLLTQIKVDFDNEFDAFDIEPISIPDLLAERPITVFGKYKGNPVGKIAVNGLTGGQSYQQTLDLADVKPLQTNSALSYLWARHRIAMLGDYNNLRQKNKYVQEITNLGLTYNLLTSYTSFIAVDSEIRRKDKDFETVTQPLPLPEGVTDFAIGRTGPFGRAMNIRSSDRIFNRRSSRMCCSMESALSFSDLSDIDESISTDVSNFLKRTFIEPSTLKIGKKKDIRGDVIIRDIIVSDRLQKRLVENILTNFLNDINDYYNKMLKKFQHLEGKVGIEFSFGQSKHAENVKITFSELDNKYIERYIILKIKKLHFPLMKTHDELTVNCTFIFKKVKYNRNYEWF